MDVILDLPTLDPQDVFQERALQSLLGHKVGYRTLYRRLQPREYLYGLVPDPQILSSAEEESPEVKLERVEQIVSWALEQTQEVQERIWRFLEDPEEELEATLAFLVGLGLTHLSESTANERSVTRIILNYLPATKEELISLIRGLHTARRPEATVRQALRRLAKKGVILQREGIYYRKDGLETEGMGTH